MALPDFAVGVSFLNAVKDNSTSFFLQVTDYYGNTHTTTPVNYGASIQFSMDAVFPPPTYNSLDCRQFGGIFCLKPPPDQSGYAVVRTRDNKVVAQQSPFKLDNTNSQLVVAWMDGQNNVYTDRVGMFGAYRTACVFGLNLAYPYADTSNTVLPTITVLDSDGNVQAGDVPRTTRS